MTLMQDDHLICVSYTSVFCSYFIDADRNFRLCWATALYILRGIIFIRWLYSAVPLLLNIQYPFTLDYFTFAWFTVKQEFLSMPRVW